MCGSKLRWRPKIGSKNVTKEKYIQSSTTGYLVIFRNERNGWSGSLASAGPASKQNLWFRSRLCRVQATPAAQATEHIWRWQLGLLSQPAPRLHTANTLLSRPVSPLLLFSEHHAAEQRLLTSSVPESSTGRASACFRKALSPLGKSNVNLHYSPMI